MRFLVSEIRDAQTVLEREETVSGQDLIGAPPPFAFFRHPVKSHVRANMTEDGDVVLMGKVTTVITFQCGRCLEFFDKPVNLSFSQVVTPEAAEEVDVDSEIRETLLIDMPLRAVCRESCKGICSSCGKNLNITTCACVKPVDSRWNALKEFPFK